MPATNPPAAAPVPLPASPTGERRLDAARVLFVLALIGSFASPPLANIGAFLGLAAFFSVPGALARLRAAALSPAGRGILLLLAVLAAAMLWADADWSRRCAAWWSWRPLLLLLVSLVVFDDPRWKDRCAWAVVAVLAVASVASFVLLMVPQAVVLDEPGILLRNHTTQGMAFVLGIILAAMLAWGRPQTPRTRALLFSSMVLFLANIAFVATGRSAHVALLVAAAVLAFSMSTGRLRWWVLVLIPLIGAAVLASSAMVRERFATAYGELGTVMTAQSETSMGLRIVIWSTTRDMILERPVLGFGVGGFAPAYAKRIHERYTDWKAAEAKDTHNQYLHVMVEAGVPGILAFLLFIAGILRQPAQAPYRGTALALFAAWLVTSLFNSHFQTFAEAHMIDLALGMLLAGAPGVTKAPQAASASVTAAATSL